MEKEDLIKNASLKIGDKILLEHFTSKLVPTNEITEVTGIEGIIIRVPVEDILEVVNIDYDDCNDDFKEPEIYYHCGRYVHGKLRTNLGFIKIIYESQLNTETKDCKITVIK